jgi:hypothetical protein
VGKASSRRHSAHFGPGPVEDERARHLKKLDAIDKQPRAKRGGGFRPVGEYRSDSNKTSCDSTGSISSSEAHQIRGGDLARAAVAQLQREPVIGLDAAVIWVLAFHARDAIVDNLGERRLALLCGSDRTRARESLRRWQSRGVIRLGKPFKRNPAPIKLLLPVPPAHDNSIYANWLGLRELANGLIAGHTDPNLKPVRGGKARVLWAVASFGVREDAPLQELEELARRAGFECASSVSELLTDLIELGCIEAERPRKKGLTNRYRVVSACPTKGAVSR